MAPLCGSILAFPSLANLSGCDCAWCQPLSLKDDALWRRFGQVHFRYQFELFAGFVDA